MMAPNIVHFRTDPQRSTTEALVKKVAQNGPSGAPLTSVAKKPPRRSSAPNSTRKLAACRPGAPYPNAIVDTISGNQHSFSANRNWETNSPPYGYGGRRGGTVGLPAPV